MKTNWYSEIPFEVKEFDKFTGPDGNVYSTKECITDCPFGMCIGHAKYNIIKVGSISESVNCDYILEMGDKTVRCSHPGNLKW